MQVSLLWCRLTLVASPGTLRKPHVSSKQFANFCSLLQAALQFSVAATSLVSFLRPASFFSDGDIPSEWMLAEWMLQWMMADLTFLLSRDGEACCASELGGSPKHDLCCSEGPAGSQDHLKSGQKGWRNSLASLWFQICPGTQRWSVNAPGVL